MALKNSTELANTQKKLRELETRYEELRVDINDDARIRKLTLISLKRIINQLKEEVARYEARFHHV